MFTSTKLHLTIYTLTGIWCLLLIPNIHYAQTQGAALEEGQGLVAAHAFFLTSVNNEKNFTSKANLYGGGINLIVGRKLELVAQLGKQNNERRRDDTNIFVAAASWYIQKKPTHPTILALEGSFQRNQNGGSVTELYAGGFSWYQNLYAKDNRRYLMAQLSPYLVFSTEGNAGGSPGIRFNLVGNFFPERSLVTLRFYYNRVFLQSVATGSSIGFSLNAALIRY